MLLNYDLLYTRLEIKKVKWANIELGMIECVAYFFYQIDSVT